MDMSDMSSLMGSGMDMSSDPMFRTYNQVLARRYWYIIAFVVGVFLLLRAMEYYKNWSRLVPVQSFNQSGSMATRVNHLLLQIKKKSDSKRQVSNEA
jgi:hypothetical protein